MKASTLVAIVGFALLTACDDATSPAPPMPEEPTYDLVFEGYFATTPELWLRRADSGDIDRVLPLDSVVMDPEPSPDGTRIAFVIANYVDATGDIFMMDYDGANIEQITFDSEMDDQPSWSPDGDRIAFRSFQGLHLGDIWLMDPDGGNQVRITFDPLPAVIDEARPAWSPDGTRIAFSSNAGGNYDIWTMATDGSDSLRITNDDDLETEPAWSPDGKSILFRRCDSVEGCDLAIVPAAGGIAVPFARRGEQRMPAWTPAGDRIVFVDHATVLARPDLYSMLADGTDVLPLVTDEMAGGSINPAFLRRRR